MMRNLAQWTFDPVTLLETGARRGGVFEIDLWRPVTVGYRPEWNKALLTDIDTFRSRGSLSALTPYLAGGVVHQDVPGHDPRRRELNPHFHAKALAVLTDRLTTVVDKRLPAPGADGFEALSWASDVVRAMLNEAFFAGGLSEDLLHDFLSPLQLGTPGPLLPRPWLFRRMRKAIGGALAEPGPDTLTAAIAHMDNAAEELRISLAAGYDTTAHTLAWAVWELAGHPQWQRADALPMVIDEVLRLYPAGWVGSRIASVDTVVTGVEIPAGRMVFYSPLLTHHDPELWPHPLVFQPERFSGRQAPWTFIPFAGGTRTCLGMHLAKLMLTTALTPLCESDLSRVSGTGAIQASITLRPRGPLRIRRG
jgi:cytochrome P450